MSNTHVDSVKVFHLVGSLAAAGLAPAGTEQGMILTIPKLDRAKFDNVVCTVTPPTHYHREIELAGIRALSLGIESKLDPRALWRLIRLLKQEQPVILHTYLFRANMIGRLSGKLASVPYIINSVRAVDRESKLRVLVNRLTSRFATAVDTNSNAGGTYVQARLGVAPERTYVIYQGVEIVQPTAEETGSVRPELGLESDSPLVGFVGRLHHVKGLPDLMKAMAIVVKALPRARFLLVGDGPERVVVKDLAIEEGIGDSAIFLGERSDIYRLISAIDLLVLSSLSEGLPRVILEAMALGKPVVATDVGGVSDAVVDGVSGLLVPPGDPVKLAQAMVKLLSDRALAGKMGSEGRKRVEEHFTIDQAVARYEQLYTLIAAGRLKDGSIKRAI